MFVIHYLENFFQVLGCVIMVYINKVSNQPKFLSSAVGVTRKKI